MENAKKTLCNSSDETDVNAFFCGYSAMEDFVSAVQVKMHLDKSLQETFDELCERGIIEVHGNKEEGYLFKIDANKTTNDPRISINN